MKKERVSLKIAASVILCCFMLLGSGCTGDTAEITTDNQGAVNHSNETQQQMDIVNNTTNSTELVPITAEIIPVEIVPATS